MDLLQTSNQHLSFFFSINPPPPNEEEMTQLVGLLLNLVVHWHPKPYLSFTC